MSIQFIIGDSGSGKTTYVYSSIIEESLLHEGTNYFVIVPEQFTLETQRKLCLMHPRGGIMNIDVLSFGRLAYRIFEETGYGGQTILDDEGKNLILRRVIDDCESRLRVLGANLRKQGYISEIKSILSEFAQYRVDLDDVEELMEQLTPESRMYLKLHDIQLILSGFYAYIEERFITKEEILEVLTTAVPESSILEDCVILLDGFTGFTPVQLQLMKALAIKAQKVLVTVTADTKVDVFRYEHPHQLFALSKQMVTRITQIVLDANLELEEAMYLHPRELPRYRGNRELQHLNQSLFRSPSIPYEETTKQISVHICHNPAGEVSWAASRIRHLVRAHQYRYQEIAVIVSDMACYIPHMEAIFASYDIPYFSDHKKSIMLNGVVDYIRSLCYMLLHDFSYDGVFRYLRSGFTQFEHEEIDLLDNYVRQYGIRGYHTYQKVWGTHIEIDSPSIVRVNRIRERFIESLASIMEVIQQPNRTVREISRMMYTFVAEQGLEEKINLLVQQLEEKGELSKAKEYSQIYAVLIDMLDKLVSLLGEDARSFEEFCDLLDAGFQEAKVGMVPPSFDQVVVGDLMRTRISEIKALIFIGTNDSFLPGSLRNTGLLSERERELLQEAKLTLSPSSKEQIYIQQFYLYLLLTKPSEFLHICYSNLSTEGKSIRPAYLLMELKRIFPNIVESVEVSDLYGESQWKRMELQARFVYQEIARALSRRELGIKSEVLELLSWAVKEDRSGSDANRYLRRIVDGAFFHNTNRKISKDLVAALYPDSKRFSVSQIEKFTECAYAHFLSYGLRLKERKEYEIQSADFGIIAHRAMERYSKAANEINPAWNQIDEQTRISLVSESVKQSIEDHGQDIIISSARRGYQEQMIHRLVERSVWALTKHLSSTYIRPSAFELHFGSGVIDRIDTVIDGDCVYVSVTDYKTGKASFDLVSLYHGLQLQLPIYLSEATRYEQELHVGLEVIPAGFFYYQMQNPIVDREPEEERITSSIMSKLRLQGMLREEEKVIELLAPDLDSDVLAYNIKRNAKTGTISKTSSCLDPQAFDTVLHYALQKREDIRTEIVSGEISIRPYEYKNNTGCVYCKYKGICGFDQKIPGFMYHELEELDKQEIIGAMENRYESNHDMDK